MNNRYSSFRFLWASSAFFLLLLVLILLVMVFISQKKVSTETQVSPLSSLTPTANPESVKNDIKTYQSKNGWKVTYGTENQVDTSIDQGSTSLERLTLSVLDDKQPPTKKTFNGYSVDFSVEAKKEALATFADKDSLRQELGTRQSFAQITLAAKTGFRAFIKADQDYYSYYLPLADETKVLIVTTSINGPNQEQYQDPVKTILNSIKLLD